jgi:deaminated glutathione amidase
MTYSKNKVAAVQLVSGADVTENLLSAERLIAEAAQAGAVMVVLPENFAVLDAGPLVQFAEREGDEKALLQGFLADQSRRHKIYLLGGTIPLISRPRTDPAAAPDIITDGRVRPASLLYDPQGQLIARYDKMHLFDVQVDDRQSTYSESTRFEPGDQVVAVDTPAGRVGLTICYDLRFPELYRRLLDLRAELLTVPSAFTQVTGAAHWEVLLRARAIENQCYVIAANQGGVHNHTRETFGHTMIIDPWGKVVACIPKGEGLALATIDLDQLHEIRRRMPVVHHRRL